VADDRACEVGPAAAEAALRAAVRREPFDAAAIDRLRANVGARWRAGTRGARGRRYALLAGLAATVVAVAVAARWVLDVAPSPAAFGIVVSAGPRDLLVQRRWRDPVSLVAGDVLPIGERVAVVADVSIDLPGGGELRLRKGTTLSTDSAHLVDLTQGALYVDLDPARPHARLDVRARSALIRHVGTQFEVAVAGALVRLRVREGAVRISGTAETEAHRGEQILVDDRGTLQRQALAPSGPEWAWIDAQPLQFDVENHTVAEFLGWLARETGRRVKFMDDTAKQIAVRSVLHGSIRGMAPDVALRNLLATTSLTAEIRDGEIQLRASAEPRPANTP
jgi:ferric-dicitrate binding protein FerR (iron transport regulator)